MIIIKLSKCHWDSLKVLDIIIIIIIIIIRFQIKNTD